MRRWKLTVVLAICAAAAALAAPRLLGEVRQAVVPPPTPMLPVDAIRSIPEVPGAPEVPVITGVPRIPEVPAVPQVPVIPEPPKVPDDFWMDAVDCGMG